MQSSLKVGKERPGPEKSGCHVGHAVGGSGTEPVKKGGFTSLTFRKLGCGKKKTYRFTKGERIHNMLLSQLQKGLRESSKKLFLFRDDPNEF